MIISFDLDDTLLPAAKSFPTETQSWLLRLLGVEKIRKGSVSLFHELKSRGHTIYIYTTSFRSSLRMLLTFHLYGIPVARFINQEHHNQTLREHKNRTSKYPPAFGIDVHVDDLPGVQIEGERYGFRTIIVAPKIATGLTPYWPNWANKNRRHLRPPNRPRQPNSLNHGHSNA